MMLIEVLDKSIAISLLGFVISSMMAMGMGLTIGQINSALRNARLVLLMLVANSY
jgi:bile acid:Na+ symporter, BASS family